jgi:hypothetical protein
MIVPLCGTYFWHDRILIEEYQSGNRILIDIELRDKIGLADPLSGQYSGKDKIQHGDVVM